MIDVKHTERADMLELHLTAPVTAKDYETVLLPAIDAAIAETDHLRLLVRLDARLSEFSVGALLEDARMGMKHWSGFDRIAVVTGEKSMRHTISALSVFMPCPVVSFVPDEEDEARRWLVESLGSIHQSDLGNGLLHLQLLGKLDSATFAGEAEDLNAFIRANERFRLLLDLRQFDGWQGLGALGSHLGLVYDHIAVLDKVAMVGDAAWEKLALTVGARIMRKDARYFAEGQFDAARDWLAQN